MEKQLPVESYQKKKKQKLVNLFDGDLRLLLRKLEKTWRKKTKRNNWLKKLKKEIASWQSFHLGTEIERIKEKARVLSYLYGDISSESPYFLSLDFVAAVP